MSEERKSIRCWYCGQLTPADQEKCVHCGTPLLTSTEDVDIDEFLDLVDKLENSEEKEKTETMEKEELNISPPHPSIPIPQEAPVKEEVQEQEKKPKIGDVPKPPVQIEEEESFFEETPETLTPPPAPPTSFKSEETLGEPPAPSTKESIEESPQVEYEAPSELPGLDIPKPPTSLSIPEEETPATEIPKSPTSMTEEIPVPSFSGDETIPVPPRRETEAAGVPLPPTVKEETITSEEGIPVPKPQMEVTETEETPAPPPVQASQQEISVPKPSLPPAPQMEEAPSPPEIPPVEEPKAEQEIVAPEKEEIEQPQVEAPLEEETKEIEEIEEELKPKSITAIIKYLSVASIIIFLSGFASITLENPNYEYTPLSFPDPNQIKINEVVFLGTFFLYLIIGYLLKSMIIQQIPSKQKVKRFFAALFYILLPLVISSIIGIMLSLLFQTQSENYVVLQINLFGATILPWISFLTFGWLGTMIGYGIGAQKVINIQNNKKIANTT